MRAGAGAYGEQQPAVALACEPLFDLPRVNLTLVLQARSRLLSTAGAVRIISCILHNDRLIDIDFDHQPSSCVRHDAWQREGLAVPPVTVLRQGWRGVLMFLRRVFKVRGLTCRCASMQQQLHLLRRALSDARILQPSSRATQLRQTILSLVSNIAAACPIFGRRCTPTHYLQPRAQLGIGPSQRRLELASLPQWHRDNLRLPLLRCSCPLSLVADRLARVTGRQESHGKTVLFYGRCVAAIKKRCLSNAAWWMFLRQRAALCSASE